jgi:hypothetical protein
VGGGWVGDGEDRWRGCRCRGRATVTSFIRNKVNKKKNYTNILILILENIIRNVDGGVGGGGLVEGGGGVDGGR